MTTLVSGDLRVVTDDPAAVSQVWIRAQEPRLHGTSYVTDNNAPPIIVEDGWVEFGAIPGPAVMLLVSGGVPGNTVKLIVPEKETATLRECIEAVGLVEDGTADTLTQLAQEVAAAAANSFHDWEALEAESEAAATAAANAKTSETNAAVSASAASTSESNAATSASSADSSATAASESANAARTSAGNAKSSETNAATSDRNAATSEANAKTSETNATTAASDALIIKNSIPQTVATEVDAQVPPKVAEVIGGDTVIRDAAAAAVGGVVESLDILEKSTAEGMIAAAKWDRGTTSVTNADLLVENGDHQFSSAIGVTGLPADAPGQMEVRGSGVRLSQAYTTWQVTPRVFLRVIRSVTNKTWYPWAEIGGEVELPDLPEGEVWHKGIVPSVTGGIDELADGVWGVSSVTVAGTLNIPGRALGNLQIQTINNGRTAWYITQDDVPQLYVSAKSGGVWGEWATASGGADEGTSVHLPSVTPRSGMKNVPLALTLGQGSSGGAPTTGSFRIPFQYEAPIPRWRVCVTTRNSRYGSLSGAASTIGKMVLAEHGGDGAMSGDLTTVAEGVTIPQYGDVYRSGWQNRALTKGTEYTLSYEYESTNGEAPPFLVGTSYDMGDSAADDMSATGQLIRNAPYDIWLEVETPAHVPTVAVVGDSTSCGVGATRPVHDSWLSVYCRRNGFLPIHYAASGDAASQWMDKDGAYQVTRWSHLSEPDAVIMALGNNDMGTSAPPMSERSTAVAEIIRNRIGHNIYATTTKPRAGTPADDLARRQEYADWLNGEGRMIYRDAFDVRTPLATGDYLNPDYDSGDGLHLNTAGYEVFASAITRPMVDGVILKLQEQASAEVNISSGDGWIAYKQGDRVDLHIQNSDGTDFTMPEGWRPGTIIWESIAAGKIDEHGRFQVAPSGLVRFFGSNGATYSHVSYLAQQ